MDNQSTSSTFELYLQSLQFKKKKDPDNRIELQILGMQYRNIWQISSSSGSHYDTRYVVSNGTRKLMTDKQISVH